MARTQGASSTKTNIEEQLEMARKKLLDLTLRNRLINYRPAKARAIRIIDEVCAEVYNILVLKERVMEFHANQREVKQDQDEEDQMSLLDEVDKSLTEEESSLLWKMPSSDMQVETRHTDRYLQTTLDSASLYKRLFYLNQQSRSVFEEQGYTVMYLALGFLGWTESADSDQVRRAPLILVPVELDRQHVGKTFKLSWTSEDIFTNVSLQAKLKEQGIELPEFEMPEDKSDIDAYFHSVSKAIKKMKKWHVTTDIYLDFFSFTKFVMYKDLDPDAWPKGMSPADHQLIKDILDPCEVEVDGGEFSEDEVDLKLQAKETYHIMDADPSQIAVIEDVKRGRNLVAEGPPGTGKSQTITNAIAELLAAGKSVLFVSEKMAALEVVKRRLDEAGIGNFCLELHSRKSNKKEVLKELEKTLRRTAPRMTPLSSKFSQLETLKTELNDYAKALRMPIGEIGYSPFDLYCMKETANRHFEDINRTMAKVKIENSKSHSQKDLDNVISVLSDLAELLPLVHPITSNPWTGCKPGTILPSDEDEIESLISGCKDALNNLEAKISALVDASAIKRPSKIEDISVAIGAAKVIAASKPVDKDVLLNSEWNKPSKGAEELIGKVEDLQARLSDAHVKFKEKTLEKDIASIVEEYKVLSAKLFRFFNGRYRYLKREIHSYYTGQAAKDNHSIITDLEELAECQKLRGDIAGTDNAGKALFGSFWNGEKSDCSMLKAFSSWVVSFRQELLSKALTDRAIEVVSAGASQEFVENACNELDTAKSRFIEARNRLSGRIGIDYEEVFGVSEDKVDFEAFKAKLLLWSNELPKLQRWSQYVYLRDECLKSSAAPMIELIESDKIESGDVVPCFKGNFADSLIGVAFSERPVLLKFVGTVHEGKIKNFAELDRDLILENRKRLAYKLYENQPRIVGGVSPGSEAGILVGEFSRKRGHMPIRKLMSLAGSFIQKIKPCFMMSPLSIAQFLDPKTARFDVIVFDEASQVKPEDALGALLRGNQAVVMGDTRQLPPTSFFDYIGAEEENLEEISASVTDVESLHQCKRSFPTKMLRWHYRSRHESLIAVSNREFYDNDLLIYPSAIDRDDDLGLHLVHIPDSVYDRGKVR